MVYYSMQKLRTMQPYVNKSIHKLKKNSEKYMDISKEVRKNIADNKSETKLSQQNTRITRNQEITKFSHINNCIIYDIQ